MPVLVAAAATSVGLTDAKKRVTSKIDGLAAVGEREGEGVGGCAAPLAPFH